MSTSYSFQGWLGLDPSSVKGNMKWQGYEPKTWEETDVDIKVTHCGICGSDLHTLRSGWAPTSYPCCVGHEVVGTAVKVGSKAERGIKVGDRVGVGAQSSSCLKPDCEECASGMENHCMHIVGTYNGKYGDGSKSYGGYSDYCRAPSHFVLKIPDAIPSEEAAPMLCGGITVFAPLKKNGCGPGKRVGIIGVGGLGHFGILYAKALGADSVTAISRSAAKKEDAMKIGADKYIATNDDKDWATHHARSLDLIVSTVSSPNMPLEQYLMLLRTNGAFIQVGAPEDSLPGFNAFSLIAKGCKIGGSAIGAPHEIEEMLELTAKKGVKPWIEKRPMKDANKVVIDMNDGKARYRYVLVNEAHA
ncbi:MAG: hypothetical protein ALECFALPRED_002216 [Alectoria fallacina]|uniref:alcohol dehydrogenase (NADP(+)) n=1 Tax=Alectoria fallacina TaxID=1903189 RepID=A0A8H3EGM8_9LECA|nr:MAG: hypothetical protein ALECFALPRED_002216 [Alectoria fallacina]